MKHLILGILLSFPLYLLAQQGEGVNTEIDSSRLEEVRGYLHNAKMDLERGLNYVEDVPLGDKEAYLASMMEQVLNNSFGQNEFLMRNILHRTKVVYDELVKTPSSPKRDATARKILEENVERALSLYQMDQRLIENTDYIVSQMKPVDFAIVGMEWTEYVISRYMDLPTNESRLNVMAATLGLLYNDILDDMKHNRLLAPVAQHIETFYSLNKDEIEALKQASGDGSRNMEKLEMARKIFGFLQRAVKSMRSLLGEVSHLPTKHRGGSNQLEMQFSVIPDGSFLMGNQAGDVYSNNTNKQHMVIITRGFEMQTTEVTQAQWHKVMGNNPSYFREQSHCPRDYDPEIGCPNHPVEEVSWNDVQRFIEELNQKINDGYIYRLPTEAEWEYAARAGTTTRYNLGDNINPDQVNYRGLNRQQTVATGSLDNQNAWGLSDMHGNVSEWVEDTYISSYEHLARINPVNCPSPSFLQKAPYMNEECQSVYSRVLRGGCWYYDAAYVRSVHRDFWGPDVRNYGVGFRLVRTKN